MILYLMSFCYDLLGNDKILNEVMLIFNEFLHMLIAT